jgi:hypothetical protein
VILFCLGAAHASEWGDVDPLARGGWSLTVGGTYHAREFDQSAAPDVEAVFGLGRGWDLGVAAAMDTTPEAPGNPLWLFDEAFAPGAAVELRRFGAPRGESRLGWTVLAGFGMPSGWIFGDGVPFAGVRVPWIRSFERSELWVAPYWLIPVFGGVNLGSPGIRVAWTRELATWARISASGEAGVLLLWGQNDDYGWGPEVHARAAVVAWLGTSGAPQVGIGGGVAPTWDGPEGAGTLQVRIGSPAPG